MHISWPVIQAGGLLTAAIGLTFALLAKTAYQRRPKETENVFGDARFMTDKELRQSGLLVNKQPADADGVYLGAWTDARGAIHYLRDVSNGHVVICGPTRSGKGVSCIIPTLLSWRGSAIVNDEKGELWEQTSAWRGQHIGPVIKWEPAARSDTSSWNPLAEVRLMTPHEVADAQNTALMLIDVKGHGLDRLTHWQSACVPLLAGCILHELYLAREQTRIASLAEIALWFADPTSTCDTLWEEMRDNTYLNGAPHPVIAAAGISQVNRSDREKSSVTSTFFTYMTLFFDNIIAANTTHSDFLLSTLADSERPITIYITTMPVDAVRLRPLMRLFLTMATRSLMAPKLLYANNRSVNPHRYETLMLLDEFPEFGRLEEIETAMAKCASWGVKFLLAIQDITQLNGIYGAGHSIMANTHSRAFFPTNDLGTAKNLSESTGTMTANTPHTSIMGRRFGLLSQVTKTITPTAKPLLTPGQILAMRAPVKDEGGRILEAGDMLLFLMGHRPLLAQQMLYFLDPQFVARSQTMPPALPEAPQSVWTRSAA